MKKSLNIFIRERLKPGWVIKYKALLINFKTAQLTERFFYANKK